jgi:predicted dehydrogenase
MVKVAIVGCGKIADQHVQAIHRIPGSIVVAACDREVRMAQQLAERFAILQTFGDMDEMLRIVSPDVVHITTPPQSHHALGMAALRAGAHVYLEKPFTVTAAEARELIECAQSVGRMITAGHNYQFTPEMMRMRERVKEGFLGGRPVHLESHWSYDLGDVSYVGPVLGNPDHWVRRLPGQLFHNIISHGIARLAEFLSDDVVELSVLAHQSDTLRKLGGSEVQDELRVMLRDSNGTTAYFSFSTQIKPGMNTFRVCGPKASMLVDLSSGELIENRGGSYKSYLTFLGPSLVSASQHFKNAVRNFVAIARWKLHHDAGMKALIERFHEAIRTSGEPPIPYREILLTASVMDRIFAQIAPARETAGSA